MLNNEGSVVNALALVKPTESREKWWCSFIVSFMVWYTVNVKVFTLFVITRF